MQTWHGSMPQPMLEELEGIPCRRGLLDGPLSLAKLLWQHATPHERESSLMKEILRSAWQLLAETLSGSTVCLREVYPTGCQSLLEVCSQPQPYSRQSSESSRHDYHREAGVFQAVLLMWQSLVKSFHMQHHSSLALTESFRGFCQIVCVCSW